MKKAYIILLVSLFLINFCYAFTINPGSWSESTNNGMTKTKVFTFSVGTNETRSLTFSGEGDISNWLTIIPESIELSDSNPSDTLTAIVVVPSDTLTGEYTGAITYTGTESGTIPITFFVQNLQEHTCNLIPYPSSYSRGIAQGATKSKQFSILVSNYCEGLVTIQYIGLDGDMVTGVDGIDRPIRIEEELLGPVQPGSTITIPIILDGGDENTYVEKGTYDAMLTVNALDSDNNPLETQISISVQVTGGISSTPEGTEPTEPTCTLTSKDINLNKTEQLICSNVHPDIKIEVDPNLFLRGIRTDEPENQWIWTFTGEKLGVTKLRWWYKYKGGVIGTYQEEEIRIMAGDAPLPGTSLKFNFYPALSTLKPGSEVAVLVVDNKTESILSEFTLYLNGEKIYDTLTDFGSNKFILESGKEYELRGSSSGYQDVLETFTLSPQTVSVTLSPASPIQLNSQITITTTPADAKVKIGDTDVNQTYIPTSVGTYTITATAEGFLPYNGTFEVIEPLSLSLQPQEEETKLGKLLSFQLNREASIAVFYKKDETSLIESLNESIAKDISISSTKVSFKPKKAGIYWLEADGILLWQYTFEGGFFKGISNWFGERNVWFWIIIIAIVTFLVYWFVLREKKGGGFGYTGEVSTAGEILKPIS